MTTAMHIHIHGVCNGFGVESVITGVLAVWLYMYVCVLFVQGGLGGTLAVCGSDGVTYASDCELRYQACVQQADIVIVAFGSCSGES